MTLDLNANRYDLSRIAAYEYLASGKMKKVYKFMVETGFPNSTEQAIYLIRNPMYKEGAGKYAFVGKSWFECDGLWRQVITYVKQTNALA